MRQILSMLLVMVFGVETATAQATFSLQPSQVRAGQNVNLRIDNPSGCYPVPQIDVLRSGDVVTVNLLTTDAGPCVPEWATPRLVPLGTFAPGHYQVQPFVCSNAPPPLPACQLREPLAKEARSPSKPWPDDADGRSSRSRASRAIGVHGY